LVCDRCAPVHHLRCDGCDEWHPAGESCLGCVSCDRCHDPVPEHDTVETVRGSMICGRCRRDWYWQGGVCDGSNRDGDNCANDCCDPDNCDCDDCRDHDDDTAFGGLVHDYSYKPCPVFHGTGPLFLGPEIEIQTPHGREEQCAGIAASLLGG